MQDSIPIKSMRAYWHVAEWLQLQKPSDHKYIYVDVCNLLINIFMLRLMADDKEDLVQLNVC
jgi:hypothetical protein